MVAVGAASVFAMRKHMLEVSPRDQERPDLPYQQQPAGPGKGFDLGTKGKGRWTREQLHNRRGEPQERDVLDRYDWLVERMAADNEPYSGREVSAEVGKARREGQSH
jgi:hypothetical protein